jgi:hypothetical protein
VELVAKTFITPLEVADQPQPWGTQCWPKVSPLIAIIAKNSNVLFIIESLKVNHYLLEQTYEEIQHNG